VSEPLKPVPKEWKPLEAEIRAYFRALPQLLADGEAGRYVVIKGDVVYDAWDTHRDARQYGYEKFDDGQFMTQPVDPKMLELLTQFFGPAPAATPMPEEQVA
jgi:hypothetical protein